MTDDKVAASRAATKLELEKLKIENAYEAPKLTDLEPSSLAQFLIVWESYEALIKMRAGVSEVNLARCLSPEVMVQLTMSGTNMGSNKAIFWKNLRLKIP